MPLPPGGAVPGRPPTGPVESHEPPRAGQPPPPPVSPTTTPGARWQRCRGRA